MTTSPSARSWNPSHLQRPRPRSEGLGSVINCFRRNERPSDEAQAQSYAVRFVRISVQSSAAVSRVVAGEDFGETPEVAAVSAVGDQPGHALGRRERRRPVSERPRCRLDPAVVQRERAAFRGQPRRRW